MKLLVNVLLFFVMVLTGCSSLPGGSTEKGILRGMVYDKDKSPVPTMDVKLYVGISTDPVITQTDINGRFSIRDIPYGNLKIEFIKPMFEKFILETTFQKETQILYAQIANREQLVKLSFNALESRDYQQARDLCDRALQLDKLDPESLFLLSYVLVAENKYQDAVDVLNRLIHQMTNPYPVHLLLADIYEKKLLNTELTEFHLREALKLKYDQKWQKRLDQLK